MSKQDWTSKQEPEGREFLMFSEEPQGSEEISVFGGFNVNTSSPRALLISASSHLKEESLCVKTKGCRLNMTVAHYILD